MIIPARLSSIRALLLVLLLAMLLIGLPLSNTEGATNAAPITTTAADRRSANPPLETPTNTPPPVLPPTNTPPPVLPPTNTPPPVLPPTNTPTKTPTPPPVLPPTNTPPPVLPPTNTPTNTPTTTPIATATASPLPAQRIFLPLVEYRELKAVVRLKTSASRLSSDPQVAAVQIQDRYAARTSAIALYSVWAP